MNANSGLISLITQSVFSIDNSISGFGYAYGEKSANFYSLNSTISKLIENRFHTFSIEWTKSGIKFFIDEKLYHSFNYKEKLYFSDELGTYEEVGQPFDHNFTFMFDTYLERGSLFNESVVLIDYVKVFKWDQFEDNFEVKNEMKSTINQIIFIITLILSVILLTLISINFFICAKNRLKLLKLYQKNEIHIKYEVKTAEVVIIV